MKVARHLPTVISITALIVSIVAVTISRNSLRHDRTVAVISEIQALHSALLNQLTTVQIAESELTDCHIDESDIASIADHHSDLAFLAEVRHSTQRIAVKLEKLQASPESLEPAEFAAMKLEQATLRQKLDQFMAIVRKTCNG